MQFIKTNINEDLLLNKHVFIDQTKNIEYLVQRAALESNLNEKLILLSKATALVEKFHSFFHFEQSFFHLQLALNYLKKNNHELAQGELKAAIFQDPLNEEAKDLLRESGSQKKYTRLFDSLENYLNFASGEMAQNLLPQSYWEIAADSEDNINKIINKIRIHHQNYHIEAAKLYLNRALVFYFLNEKSLSKNDIIKAINLDNSVKSKEYFDEIISQMGRVVVIGLGSNLGDRMFYLKNAIKMLEEQEILEFITQSSIEETKAVLLTGSPPQWDIPFLNMVIKGITKLSPEELVKKTQLIEQHLGREPADKWAPRVIDIDILSYDNIVISSENIQIPHPRLLEREWVIKHFVEVYPNWKHPIKNQTIMEIYKNYD